MLSPPSTITAGARHTARRCGGLYVGGVSCVVCCARREREEKDDAIVDGLVHNLGLGYGL